MKFEPNAWKVPAKLRAKEAARDAGYGLIPLAAVVAVAIFVTLTNGINGEGVWAVYALALAMLLAVGWAAFYSWKIRGHVRYEVGGITVIFCDDRFYVPPSVFLDFVERNVWDIFKRAQTESALLIAETDPPRARVKVGDDGEINFREEGGVVEVRRVLGASDLYLGVSRIHAPRILDPGVAGYELRMQAARRLIGPDRGEQDYIDIINNLTNGEDHDQT